VRSLYERSQGVEPLALIVSTLYFSLLMVQTYPRTEREKLNLIARAAYERTRPRHQETLRRLRLLATAI